MVRNCLSSGNAIPDRGAVCPYRSDTAPGWLRHLREPLGNVLAAEGTQASESASRDASSTALGGRGPRRTGRDLAGKCRPVATIILLDRQTDKPIDRDFSGWGRAGLRHFRPGSTGSTR